MEGSSELGKADGPRLEVPAESNSGQHAYSAVTLVWNRQGQRIATRVLGKPITSFGRSSDRDVCLRLEPTEIPANRDKTFHISIRHFDLRYFGQGMEIIDNHSTNGTRLKSIGQLQPGLAVPLQDRDIVTVADVLNLQVEFGRRYRPVTIEDDEVSQIRLKQDDITWLSQHLIGSDRPGILDYLRLRRIDNVPEEEYVLLFGLGSVGHSGTALIPLGPDATTKPGVRALDLGDTTPDYPAAFHWADGALRLKCYVADQVHVDGTAVGAGEDMALADGETIEVLGQQIQVITKSYA